MHDLLLALLQISLSFPHSLIIMLGKKIDPSFAAASRQISKSDREISSAIPNPRYILHGGAAPTNNITLHSSSSGHMWISEVCQSGQHNYLYIILQKGCI